MWETVVENTLYSAYTIDIARAPLAHIGARWLSSYDARSSRHVQTRLYPGLMTYSSRRSGASEALSGHTLYIVAIILTLTLRRYPLSISRATHAPSLSWYISGTQYTMSDCRHTVMTKQAIIAHARVEHTNYDNKSELSER